MINSQEVLTEYKKLLLNQNSILQTQWGTVELNSNQFKNYTNNTSKNILYTRKKQKVVTKSLPSLIINLTTSNYPVYKFNGIDTVYKENRENNIFLSLSNNISDISYNTEDLDFVEISTSNSLEESTNEEININSREGGSALEYNYSLFSLSIRFFEDESFVGSKAIIAATKKYEYTETPQFSNDNILLLDNIFTKPQNVEDSEIVIEEFMLAFGLIREEAEEFYDYIQDILNLLNNNPEVKVRNVINFSSISYLLLKNGVTDAPINIPDPPEFILGRVGGLSLGESSNKFTDDFSSYSFDIGRKRIYQIGRNLGNPFLLIATDFSISTLQPSPPVSPIPYEANNSGLRIDFSNIQFSLIISDTENNVIQNDALPSSLVINITGRFFYKLTKNSSDYEELKSFSFSFSDGELQGDFIFGNEFIFDSPYLAYYLVIDSFEVQI